MSIMSHLDKQRGSFRGVLAGWSALVSLRGCIGPGLAHLLGQEEGVYQSLRVFSLLS